MALLSDTGLAVATITGLGSIVGFAVVVPLALRELFARHIAVNASPVARDCAVAVESSFGLAEPAPEAAAPVARSEGRRTRSTKADSQRERLAAFLAEHGPHTDEEMQDKLGMPANTQRPRRGELVEDGRVKPTGEVRPTRSGRMAVVWAINQNSEAAAA